MKPIIKFMLVLLVTATACRFGMAPAKPTEVKAPATATRLPATLTARPSPTASATPLPTLAPSATPRSCTDGDCITACYLKLAPIANPADLRARRLNRPVDNAEGFTLVSYSVDGDQLADPLNGKGFPAWMKPFQQDRKAQQQVWDFFTALIPLDQRKYLTEYNIFSDGSGGILAMVAQTDTNMNHWALDVDIFDAANAQDLTTTLIHEFGHLLTLNPSQVLPSARIFKNPDNYDIYDAEVYACKTYFPGEGCSLPESYINLFYQRFWKKIEPQWLALDSIESDDEYQAALDRLFLKYQDQFVTDYAATNVSEDMAETFSVFIIEPKPTSDAIADQKVLFFYEFPEFVKLRAQIAHNLCAQLDK